MIWISLILYILGIPLMGTIISDIRKKDKGLNGIDHFMLAIFWPLVCFIYIIVKLFCGFSENEEK